jgi:SAM-dependent methyltransferase|tara:strand:- start:926 stop:1588 length:663 start_codon:yes stop_codon:yes gene_type:complete
VQNISGEQSYKSSTSVHNAAWESETHYVEHPWTPQKRVLSLAALQPLGNPENVRILDYGCGDAKMVQFFYEQGYQVEGTDISAVVINKNTEDYPHLNFKLATPENPAPYPDNSFDAIFSSEVIEHVYDVDFVFSEFNRMLRPEGKLLLTTPYHGLVKNLVIALFYFDTHYSPTWEHIRFFTKNSLGQVCRAHGFTPSKWSRVGRIGFLARSFFLTCKKTH